MKAFKVFSPGVLTTYQDLGRRGYRQFGIPISGAMDTFALRAANLMVGNRESETGLEVTLMGLKMVSLRPALIAVTGADLNFTINSEYHPPWKRFSLKAGDVIHFQNRRSGLRAYLAVHGGFLTQSFMGSGSVFQRGLMGTPLKKDELLEVDRSEEENYPGSPEFQHEPFAYVAGQSQIRVILGPQAERFTEEGLAAFLSSPYKIKSQSDRMAYRLEGTRITHRGKADIISEPLLPGAIQVPNDGNPIILMADGQTTGGYAKIANVISADLPVLAQRIPGEALRFGPVDLDAAYNAMEERNRLLLHLKEDLPSP